MNKDEVIEIAKQAGFYINDELTITSPFIEDICISPMLKEFAKLVAEKEREECANICETLELPEWPNKVRQPLAQAIRARGQE